MFNFRIHVDRIQRTVLIENTNKKVGIETKYNTNVRIYKRKTNHKIF